MSESDQQTTNTCEEAGHLSQAHRLRKDLSQIEIVFRRIILKFQQLKVREPDTANSLRSRRDMIEPSQEVGMVIRHGHTGLRRAIEMVTRLGHTSRRQVHQIALQKDMIVRRALHKAQYGARRSRLDAKRNRLISTEASKGRMRKQVQGTLEDLDLSHQIKGLSLTCEEGKDVDGNTKMETTEDDPMRGKESPCKLAEQVGDSDMGDDSLLDDPELAGDMDGMHE